MIVPTANYPTSRDYRQLWELAHTAAVVCIVDMDHGKPDTCRDIARSVHSPEWSPELVQVGSRGIGHVWAESLEAFIAGCEQCNLEWLVPPAALVQPEELLRVYCNARRAYCHDGPEHIDWQRDAERGATLAGLGAVLARWGRPASPAAPESTWTEFIRELARIQYVAQREGQGPRFDLVIAAKALVLPVVEAERASGEVTSPCFTASDTQRLIEALDFCVGNSDCRPNSGNHHALLERLKSGAAPPAPEASNRQIEETAKLIYASMRFAATDSHGACDWVERGNSLMQNEARRTARAILAGRDCPAAPPAPEAGEVGELDLLTSLADRLENAIASRDDYYDDYGKPHANRYVKDLGIVAVARARATTLLSQQLSAPAPVVVPVAMEALARLYWWGGGAWSYGYSADVDLGVRDWINGGMAGDLPPLPARVADRCPPLPQAGEVPHA